MNKTFTVNGMKCPHCKANVENALNSIDGVAEAVASVENHNVVIDYDDSKVSLQQLKEAVDNAGHYELIIHNS